MIELLKIHRTVISVQPFCSVSATANSKDNLKRENIKSNKDDRQPPPDRELREYVQSLLRSSQAAGTIFEKQVRTC